MLANTPKNKTCCTVGSIVNKQYFNKCNQSINPSIDQSINK